MDMAQSAAPQDPAQPAAPQGFVIEVKCYPGGNKFVISKEDMETPEQEGAEGESEDSGQTAGSVGEMLKIVMSIAKNEGATDGGQSQFMAGYNEPAEPA